MIGCKISNNALAVADDVRIKRNARSLHLRLLVRRDRSIIVTAPRRATLQQVHAFVAAHASWIQQQLQHLPEPTVPTSTDYRGHRDLARVKITQLVKRFSQANGFSFSSIQIRNQSTRWGSCSRAGRLSFNWKIILLPVPVQEYIVVHELCHLREMNHGPLFWQLVGSILPDFQERRRALRRETLS